MPLLGLLSALLGGGASLLSGAGSIASGKAQARSAQFAGIEQNRQALFEAGQSTLRGYYEGSEALRTSAAQAEGYLSQIPGLQLRGQTEKLAGDVEARAFENQGREELSQASQTAQEHRRTGRLALSTLQNRAAASGFSATDATSLNLSGEIGKYVEQQAGTELYGGFVRKDALETAASARRFTGESANYASLLEAESAASAAGHVLKAGQFSADQSRSVSSLIAQNSRLSGQYALSSGKAAGKSAKSSGYLAAAGTIIGGVASFADKYDTYKGFR